MKRDETVLTTFGRHLWENRISDAQFAEMMAKHLRLKTFSKRTVRSGVTVSALRTVKT